MLCLFEAYQRQLNLWFTFPCGSTHARRFDVVASDAVLLAALTVSTLAMLSGDVNLLGADGNGRR